MLVTDVRQYWRQLRDWNWTMSGTLDVELELRKSTSYSLLKAEVIIKKSDVYTTSARLVAPEEDIVRIDYTSVTQDDVINDLGRRVISLFEAYFTGNTNERHILEVHRKYII